jgi:hypothetical protein
MPGVRLVSVRESRPLERTVGHVDVPGQLVSGATAMPTAPETVPRSGNIEFACSVHASPRSGVRLHEVGDGFTSQVRGLPAAC